MRKTFASIITTKHPRLFLWSPAAMMVGIVWYFVLVNEPDAIYGQSALGVSMMVLAFLWRSSWRVLVVPFFLVSLGFFAAQLRTQIVATPLLHEEVHNRMVEGMVEEIDPVEDKEKLILSHLFIEDVAPDEIPLRVRISFRHADPSLRVGDQVSMAANLYPLPSPVMPGSYDFARHFYFRGIGGNGFALRPAQLVSVAHDSGWHAWLNNLRHDIGENMRAGMPGAVGTVAAAMTVGETGPIPADVKASLRDSGLAHMLAIAGLHLGIVTGIVFYNVRLLLILYPPLALRLPVKKIAALFGLAAAIIYLMLAGGPIPAQRAFIMALFLFTAILLDRKALTLRTLVIAAMIMLTLFPESMFGPSFQMSFAATLAIVSLYERFGSKLHGSGTFLSRAWAHLLGIIATSLVATLATCPFVLYHFNRFAIFGLLSNMVVVPLATFVIMPGMVLALLLMPFGLEWIGYAPMEFGTDLMIKMAKFVTELPYSSIHLPSLSNTGLVLSAFGLLWLCLAVGKYRLVGFAIIAAGLGTIAQHIPVDVLVSDGARQVMVRLDSGHYASLRGTARSYAIDSWLRAEGEDTLAPQDSEIVCDKVLCSYQHHGRILLMVKKPDEGLQQACALVSDVLIAWEYLSAANCPGAKMRIGRSELERFGAHALWFDQSSIRVAHTHNNKGHRVWQPQLNMSTEGEGEE